jgi:hypothetical protein
MKQLWARRTIDAPAEVAWRLISRPEQWPEWGPSVQHATIDGGEMQLGSRGSVTTLLGIDLPFEVTAYQDGVRWAWNVAGIPATDHTVEALGPDRCRVGFAVPWPAAPYLIVCRIALQRLDVIVRTEKASA